MMFQDEKDDPQNGVRTNFVFMAYPYEPAIPRDDYHAVVRELQSELPLRLWYFSDEITTQEMMRKIWRAILRSSLCVFDISRGNANVSFELGLAAAIGKPCITLLKAGEPNPLGAADLGYSERVEYTSREALKSKLKQLLLAKSSAMRTLKDVSYAIQNDLFNSTREEDEQKLLQIVSHVFHHKKVRKPKARDIFDDGKRADIAMNALRDAQVLRVEGAKKGATWVFTDSWAYRDHEVAAD